MEKKLPQIVVEIQEYKNEDGIARYEMASSNKYLAFNYLQLTYFSILRALFILFLLLTNITLSKGQLSCKPI